jgi:6-pyruvoyltetrahydropterin/6-carboxytetrahydropterin synthase
MRGLGVYGELDVTVQGDPDPVTGYLVNISVIDAAVREAALPMLERGCAEQFLPPFPPLDPAALLPAVTAATQSRLAVPVTSVRWRLTPTYSIAFEPAMPNRVLLRQRFEFSAAHRLHCPNLDEAANRKLFGKCNNPHGHGHNYGLEVSVAVPLEPASRCTLERLEETVDRSVVSRFDHTHLNLDTVEFATRNPSVEHIAQVCHDLLLGPLAELGGELRSVTVWETEKTACTYPA